MNVIILAAGMGTRLRPYTSDKPKALVEVNGRPILDYQLDSLKTLNNPSISLVTGYKSECFKKYGFKTFHNAHYASSNMLYSLFKAQTILNKQEDVLICYGDIIYSPEILKKLVNCHEDVCISADLNWYNLWKSRMENPLDDAESFILEEGSNKVLELGKPLTDISQAQAQYMGLIKLTPNGAKQLVTYYQSLPEAESKNLYMTDFIQGYINNGGDVRASLHSEPWYEIDSVEDLQNISPEKFKF